MVAGGLVYCVAMLLRGPTDGLSDANAMQRAILAHIPVGTALEDAINFMRQERFQCDRKYTDQTFTMNSSDSGGATRHGLDFVYCERTDKAGLLEVRIWGVALVVADGRVTEVLVRSSVFGM